MVIIVVFPTFCVAIFDAQTDIYHTGNIQFPPWSLIYYNSFNFRRYKCNKRQMNSNNRFVLLVCTLPVLLCMLVDAYNTTLVLWT